MGEAENILGPRVEYRGKVWVPFEQGLGVGKPCPLCRQRVVEIREGIYGDCKMLTLRPCGCELIEEGGYHAEA